MLLTMHLSVFAWRTNTNIHERADPAVPELDSDALFSDKRGVLVPRLPESLRGVSGQRLTAPISGIMLRRERETQLLRDYTLGPRLGTRSAGHAGCGCLANCTAS